ncbi:MAG: queuosine precursor transporter [Bacteroidetes bacterium]|nr:queuosine precursor transporter [Bacteroidota bacterium]
MDFNKRKDLVFIILAGFFITNAIVAELIGGKLIQFFGLFTQSIGIILWPVVFILTDLINEHYGKQGVRKLTYITVGLIAYTFILISIGLNIKAVAFSPVNDETFNTVFGQSQWIIVGSIIAFFVSQLVDVYVFWLFRNKTGKSMIWLRATGSTVVSQLVDTFIVQYVAFVLPGKWTMNEFIHNATWGYSFKLLIAICLIPFIYLGHFLINKYLKRDDDYTDN